MSQNAPSPATVEYTPEVRAATPGKTLGIIGFVLSLLGPLTFVGLVLSIIATVQSRKAKTKNGIALAGIIIGALGTVIAILLIIAGIASAAAIAQQCAELGPGVHQSGSVTITCGG